MAKQWRANQQQLTTHFDMHYTLRNLMIGSGSSHKSPAPDSFCKHEQHRETPELNLTRNSANGCGYEQYVDTDNDDEVTKPPWAYDLAAEQVPDDRSCLDAHALSNFCLCDSLSEQARDLESDAWSEATAAIVSVVNTWTGNGSLGCELLEPTDFKVESAVQLVHGDHEGDYIALVTSKRDGRPSFSAHLDKSKVLRSSFKYKTSIPDISRHDRYGDEHCLNVEANSFPNFRESYNISKQLNLEWCRCRN